MVGAEVLTVPYWDDNYGFIIKWPDSDQVTIIDAGDGQAYLEAIARHNWSLGDIWLTHHHDDHCSHLAELKRAAHGQVFGPQGMSGVDRGIGDGETLAQGGNVIATPGHTLDMLNFYVPGARAVFTGDTLFTLGCGRIFEGTAEMMFASLQKLKALPEETQVYGAHEYTLANLEFALSEFPDHPPLLKRGEQVRAQRAASAPTVPSLLADELATNPFLLAQTPEEFARLRAAKDAF